MRDEVRKSEYRRLSGQDRSYIKRQKYTLLSRRENLTLKGRQALKKVLTANKRDLILEHRPHPEQGFRSGLGILRLARPFGVGRPEAAASRAIEIGALTYGSVRSILDHKLDRHAANERPADGAPILHPNIRGARYYN